MKKILPFASAAALFLTASSAFACGPAFNTSPDRGFLAIIIAVVPAAFYGLLSLIYLFAMRKNHKMSLGNNLGVWFKATTLAYITSVATIFLATTLDHEFVSISDNFIRVFVATTPLVVLSGYFTRLYFKLKRVETQEII